MTLSIEKVLVDLGERSYEVIVTNGNLGAFGERVSSLDTSKLILVVTDRTVKRLYWPMLRKVLINYGLDPHLFVVSIGAENSKKFGTLTKLYNKLYELNFDRKSLIIGFGGGGVGDITCFAAGTYLRGIPFVQLPTTLLAQSDSGIGGKGAVHYKGLANLIGVYHQPKLVWVDTNFLSTLPDRDYISGFSEILKSLLIGDKDGIDALLSWNGKLTTDLVSDLITRACKVKASLVSMDERELGHRLILNYGHTIGHAVEEASNFQYTHGESVAIGMMGAAYLGKLLDITPIELVRTQAKLLRKFGLPNYISNKYCDWSSGKDIFVDKLIALTYRDKKVQKGKRRFIILKAVSDPVVVNDVPNDILRKTLFRLFE